MRAILSAAVVAADPAGAVHHAVANDPLLSAGPPVRLLAVGKAAGTMARAALSGLRGSPLDTLVVVPHGWLSVIDGARVITAAHPLPDASSLHAGREVTRFLNAANQGEVVLALISGGASALCAAPLEEITIEQYAQLVAQLMRAGADIHELNTVRAHIDALKGGGMAALAAPAQSIALVVSDVVGNAPHTIASGPFTPHPSVPRDAALVLERYGLWEHAPDSVRSVLARERPTRAAPAAVRIILDNARAVAGAVRAASALGYRVDIARDPITGSARAAGEHLAARARNVARNMTSGEAPICLLSGGETTVRVAGSGMGGRNQELALASAIALDGSERIALGSIGTDGVDGPTDAAGAVVDGYTIEAASAARLDASAALANNDSYGILDRIGALIRVEPTGTNVMDVQAVVVDPP